MVFSISEISFYHEPNLRAENLPSSMRLFEHWSFTLVVRVGRYLFFITLIYSLELHILPQSKPETNLLLYVLPAHIWILSSSITGGLCFYTRAWQTYLPGQLRKEWDKDNAGEGGGGEPWKGREQEKHHIWNYIYLPCVTFQDERKINLESLQSCNLPGEAGVQGLLHTCSLLAKFTRST